MDKVGDIFTALPFSNSVLEALKLVAAAAAAMTFLDVEAVHLNFLLNCIKCGASLVVYLDTSKLVLIFPGILYECPGSALSVYFWWCNLELQVCSKSVIFNKP